MNAPGRPHVRIFQGAIYIERVPNAWVTVADKADWDIACESDREYLISRALKVEKDFPLPSPKTSGPTELPPIA